MPPDADRRQRVVLAPGVLVHRSARGIERACVEDVAYRVVAGNLERRTTQPSLIVRRNR